MNKYSFIDFGLKDFLRDENDNVIIIECKDDMCFEAEEWLLQNGDKYGWTNSGVQYFNWSEYE